MISLNVFVPHTETAELIFHDFMFPGRPTFLLSSLFFCLTWGWYWQKTAATQNNIHSSLYCLLKPHSFKVPLSLATISRWIPLWPGNYLPAVALGRGRGRGALVNRCGGGLVDWGATPLLRAHGAAVGATLVLVVVRHVGHQLAPWTSLSTGPRGSAASSDTRSQLAVHLKKKKHKGQEVTPSHLPHFPHSVAVLLMPDTDPQECKIQQHFFVWFIPWRDVRLNYAELDQFQYVNLTHRCSVETPWDVLWSVGF